MKITIHPYSPNWPDQFIQSKTELHSLLKEFNPFIEHIGSTSINEMAAKPIIDILIGISSESDLDKTPTILINHGYIYFEKYNASWPTRRFFVKLKSQNLNSEFLNTYKESDNIPDSLHDQKFSHIHIIEHGTHDWHRHIAFRDYLRNNVTIAMSYQNHKLELSKRDWVDGNEYNSAKNDFIKNIEAKALRWYKK